MGEFCEDVKRLIGEELRVVGATHIKDTTSGEGRDETEVCYFSTGHKIIAICYSPRDGATCFISNAESADVAI